MGEPRFSFVVETPASVTRPGHDFNIKKSAASTQVNFGMVRGGWLRNREDNDEGIGRTNERTGQAVLYHWKHHKTHAEIRQLLSGDGAVIMFDGARCAITAIVEDRVQDATVIDLMRQGNIPDARDGGPAARTRTLGLLGKVVTSYTQTLGLLGEASLSLFSSLVERWELNEAAAANRLGSQSVYDLDDVNNNVGQVAGALGDAAEFTAYGAGPSKRLQGPFSLPDTWSFCAWFRPVALPISAGILLAVGDGNQHDYAVYTWNDGFLYADANAPDYGFLTIGEYSLNTTYFIAVGWDDSTKEFWASVNGAGVVSGNYPDFVPLDPGEHHLCIGGFPDTEWNIYQYEGWAQKAAVWGRRLNTADIARLWNGGTPLPFSEW